MGKWIRRIVGSIRVRSTSQRKGKLSAMSEQPRVAKVTADQLKVPAQGDDAAALADLLSVEKDLEETREFALSLQAMPASTHPGDDYRILRNALWKAVVISYRRAFTGGKSFVKGRSRAKYPSDQVDSLSDDERAIHDEMLHEADKHVAHRVDDDREAGDVSILLNPPHDRGVQAVAWGGHRFSGARDEVVEAVVPLCDHLSRQLEVEIAELTNKVHDQASADVDGLYRAAGFDDPGT